MFKKFISLFALISLGAEPVYAASLPGATIANEKLIQDTLPTVYMSVAVYASGCDDFSVSNTKVLQEPHDLKTENGRHVAGKWQELWTVKACQKSFDVPVYFILDPTGATYAVDVRAIREVSSTNTRPGERGNTRLNLDNPNGTAKVAVDFRENAETGEISVVSRDANTGKVISETSGKKNEYIDSVSNIPGASHEIHLQKSKTHADAWEGTIKASTPDGGDIDVSMQGDNLAGTISESNSKYKTKITFNNGSAQAEFIDVNTQKVLFTVKGNEDYGQVYDANNRLIAEGSTENPKIYDKKAYAEFERVSDYEDEEEDDFDIESFSDLRNLLGF